MSEFLTSDNEFLPVQEVFSIRAVAMGVVAERARRIVGKPKMTGFVLYESSPEDIDSHTTEMFMGVIAKRPAYDYWQLTISFRSMLLANNLRYSNTLEVNRFNWNQQGVCVGTKQFIDTYNPIVSSVEHDSGTIDTTQGYREEWWRPLDVSDCDDITNRMLDMMTVKENK